MTLEECINRGFNLLVTAFLFLGGFAFGSVAFSPVENDWFDRLAVRADRSWRLGVFGTPG